MNYKLHVVRVYVADWERALAFYSGTLEIPVSFADADSGWAELDTGEAHLALERIDPGDPEAAGLLGRYLSVSLRVENIRETYETLAARGVNFLAPPERQPWGGVLAHLCDPEGNVLTLLGS